jgi:hypothetical protein
MARNATPAPESREMPANAVVIAEESAAANQLAVMTIEANAQAMTVAKQVGYSGSITVGALEDEIRFYQRRTVEAVLETGKRLLVLKELTRHGEFAQRVEMLGFSERTAQRFMQAAMKTAKSANLAALGNQVKSASAFLELVTHDDDVLENLAEMDDIDRLSASELRTRLREAKAEKEASDKLLDNKNKQIDKLEREKQRIACLAPDEALASLKTEATRIATDAVGAIKGGVRQALVKLHELPSSASQTAFAAGLLGELQAEINALREEFSRGKESGLQVMEHDKFYKNKPANLSRIAADRVWSYEISDHNSASIYLEYVMGAESAAKESTEIVVIRPYVLAMEENDIKGKTLKSASIAEAIIFALDPHAKPKISSQARFRQAHELLRASAQSGHRHLLLIEEAHNLPVATLKHLKRWLELKDGMRRLLGIALIGQPELRNRLSAQNPEVREVAQRCEIVELEPLNKDLEGYLKHKFARFDLKYEDVLAPLKVGAEVAQEAIVSLGVALVATGKSIGVLAAAVANWDFSQLKESFADIEKEAKDKILKAAQHNDTLRKAIELSGDAAAKAALAQQQQALATEASGNAAAKAGDDFVRLANGYRLVLEFIREQIAEQEKSVAARDAEGKAVVAQATAFGTEIEQRQAHVRATAAMAEETEKLAKLRRQELDSLKEQLKAQQEEAKAHGAVSKERTQQLEDLAKQIGLRQQDADKAVAQAQAARLAAEAAKAEAEAQKDNSTRELQLQEAKRKAGTIQGLDGVPSFESKAQADAWMEKWKEQYQRDNPFSTNSHGALGNLGYDMTMFEWEQEVRAMELRNSMKGNGNAETSSKTPLEAMRTQQPTTMYSSTINIDGGSRVVRYADSASMQTNEDLIRQLAAARSASS